MFVSGQSPADPGQRPTAHEPKTDLIRKLEILGCLLIRHGGKHDWYRNPKTGIAERVPRHKEVNEILACFFRPQAPVQHGRDEYIQTLRF